ncbi:hypothetical protein HYS91_04570 [Candidatus Daviesbacteria bacterium]|nr:hypothetical protein [Candidatus Daviesbacteria bacterium]
MIKSYPYTKEVLTLLGITGFVALSLLMPGLPVVLSPLLRKQYKTWGHFDKRRLKFELNRLQKSGIVEKIDQDGDIVYKLTSTGSNKLFKLNLNNPKIEKRKWDGKWRLVAYDIPKGKKSQAEAFRSLLKKMQFYNLQKSLWLIPYPCKEEIELLKKFYNLGNNVTLLTIKELEAESVYKRYFGI